MLFQPCSVPLRLRRLHYTDFTGDYATAFADLRRSLEPFFGRSPTSEAATAPAPPAWELDARALLAQGLKIDAVKSVRAHTGLGVKESKDLVESWAPRTAARSWEQDARALLAQGRTIDAIKLVREHTGLGTKEAKALMALW